MKINEKWDKCLDEKGTFRLIYSLMIPNILIPRLGIQVLDDCNLYPFQFELEKDY